MRLACQQVMHLAANNFTNVHCSVYTDGPFVMHYVDEAGNEISPTAALQKK